VIAYEGESLGQVWERDLAPFFPMNVVPDEEKGHVYVVCQGGNLDDPIFVLDARNGEPLGPPVRVGCIWSAAILDPATHRLYTSSDPGGPRGTAAWQRFIALEASPAFGIAFELPDLDPVYLDARRGRLLCQGPVDAGRSPLRWLDTATREVTAPVRDIVQLERLRVDGDPETNRIYAWDPVAREIQVLDGATLERIGHITLADKGVVMALRVDVAHRRLYVAAKGEKKRTLYSFSL
jgi:hypothetical protein